MLRTNGKSRGQVLVLSCATMLILALMLMFSFNLSNAINEKMRLQSQADAQAYSSAIIEARALNTLAYTNRAIASMLVAQMAIHGWMAIGTQAVANHKAFVTAFVIVGVIEIALCVACCWKCCIKHCRDAIKAFRIARKHRKEARKHGNDIKNLEDKFNKRIKGFSTAINVTRLGQIGTVTKASAETGGVGSMLTDLKANNAPKADYKTAVALYNAAKFRCSLEGMPGGSTGCGSASQSSLKQRGQYMSESANAARRSFERSANSFLVTGLDEMPMMSHLRGLQNNEGTHFFMYSESARARDNNTRQPAKDKDLNNVGGFTYGHFLLVQWRHGVGFGANNSTIISQGGGKQGRHTDRQAHSGNHGELRACSEEECFVNFRAQSDENADWNQPTVYGAVSQKLRENRDGADKPFELNTSGEISIELEKGNPAKVKLVPEGTGVAVAKGKAYYHQLTDKAGNGGWKHAPNMFDPFWRAKLHPFTRREMITALTAAGDVRGATIAAGGPVEGR